MADSWRGSDDHRRVVGQLGEQAARASQELLHLAVDVGEELAHLLALVRPERARAGQVVDEEAVSLVGGDAPRAGVRLHQVAVALERRHLAAHRGRGHLHPGVAGDVGRADGLGGVDVLRHHGVQDGGLALIEALGVIGGDVGRRPRRGARPAAGEPAASSAEAGASGRLGAPLRALGALAVVGRSWSWHSSLPSATPVPGPAGARLARAPSASTWPRARLRVSQSSRRSAEMKASWGTSTRPMDFIFFLPSFWRSRSLRLRRDVAAVALGEDVLALGLDRLPGDDPAAHGGLDGHVEELARDERAQLLGHAPPVGVGL